METPLKTRNINCENEKNGEVFKQNCVLRREKGSRSLEEHFVCLHLKAYFFCLMFSGSCQQESRRANSFKLITHDKGVTKTCAKEHMLIRMLLVVCFSLSIR